jgi:transposase-like protein
MPKRYDDDFRDWAVLQMMPPLNRSVAELAVAIGVTPQSLRNWRQMARDKGLMFLGIIKPAISGPAPTNSTPFWKPRR